MIRGKIASGLPRIVTYLGNKKFLIGDNETYMDFYFFEICKFMLMIQPNLYKMFPTLETYVNNVASLTGLKEYLADPNRREATYTFNNKSASVNGTENTQTMPKLHYFDVYARAEPMRMMMIAAGVSFEDVHYTGASWKALKESGKLEFG